MVRMNDGNNDKEQEINDGDKKGFKKDTDDDDQDMQMN